jgi:hypothetical protein
LSVGLVAAGRLAAAALLVASRRPLDLDAIVCRGGRIDLTPDLEFIVTPTLLIASATDPDLLGVNEAVFQELRCQKRFDILAGALNELDDEHSFEIAIEETLRWLQRMPAFRCSASRVGMTTAPRGSDADPTAGTPDHWRAAGSSRAISRNAR